MIESVLGMATLLWIGISMLALSLHSDITKTHKDVIDTYNLNLKIYKELTKKDK